MKILIGITGSIAAIKLPELIHQLVLLRHQCKVIITTQGLNFITPMSLACMGAEVYFDDQAATFNYDQIMAHINLAKWADHILIAPASANTISKLAFGIADNLLLQTVLASNSHKIVVPAMNQQMWKAPQICENITKLKKLGFTIWGPIHGLQACGDLDVGRMLEVEDIIAKLLALELPQVLAGKCVVITAGATIEAIDPVRYISNYSSGKMGYALAAMALNYGAKVILISGNTNLDKPHGIDHFYPVRSSNQMLAVAEQHAKNADIFISCAAVCDYQIDNVTAQKIKSNAPTLQLTLIKTPDIVATIKNKHPNLYTVGFAAETNNVIEYAINKLINKNLDLIIANDVSNDVFGSDFNQATIIDKNLEQLTLPKITKISLAQHIFDKIVQSLLKL